MNYTFRQTKAFRKSFNKLPKAQQQLAKEKFKIFKKDPWDPSLKTHIIHKLTARMKQNVYSSWIEGDLRVVFRKDPGNVIISIDIGNHGIYQ